MQRGAVCCGLTNWSTKRPSSPLDDAGEMRAATLRSCKKFLPTKGGLRGSPPTSMKRRICCAETIENSDYLRYVNTLSVRIVQTARSDFLDNSLLDLLNLGLGALHMPDGSRRFPTPWRAEPIPGGYVVRDANGQALAYLYSRDNPTEALQAKMLTKDEAPPIRIILTARWKSMNENASDHRSMQQLLISLGEGRLHFLSFEQVLSNVGAPNDGQCHQGDDEHQHHGGEIAHQRCNA
jgi:hypothetical protein